MRAVFEKNLDLNIINDLTVTGERCHHLNVVRAKIGDEILVFDGKGGRGVFELESLSKKEARLIKKDFTREERIIDLKLFVANPKKDAFEDILKIAVECGFSEIYPLKTKYSQFDYVGSERVDRLIESALVQSNNLYAPIIHEQQSLEEFLKKNIAIDFCLLFSSIAESGPSFGAIKNLSVGVFIGPEAGFSLQEEEQILKQKNSFRVHLPSPILRSPTAVAVSSGYVYAQLKKGN